MNNYGFDVLRSNNNLEWEKIGFVQGYGNSNSPKNYFFIDEDLLSGKYFYRLKQIDFDGKFEYSNIIEADYFLPVSLQLKQNYPNPFNPTTTIEVHLPESDFITLDVFNLIGERVKRVYQGNIDSGIHKFDFDASGLNSGVYFYQVQTSSGMLNRKMTIIK